MLKPPSDRGKLTKDKVRALTAITVLILVSFIVKELFSKKEMPVSTKPTVILINGQDTTIIDMSGWDSIKMDSFIRAHYYESILSDDSSYEYTDEEILDSLPDLPAGLVDSFLLQVRRYDDLQRNVTPVPKGKIRD